MPADVTFDFATDQQGWVGGGATTDVTMSRTTAEGQSEGACLQYRVAGKGANPGQSWWEWTGTFEDLGVPAGNVVTEINGAGSFWWRCSEFTAGHNNGNVSGPLEVRDAAGNLIGTLSLEGAEFTGTSDWAQVGSTAVPISGLPSDTTIRLRMNVRGRCANTNGAAVTIRQDTVRIVTTHEGAPEPPGQVTGLAITPDGHDKADWAWDTEPDADTYGGERERWDGNAWVETTSVFTSHVPTTFAESDLTPETLYRGRVRAVNDAGEGDWSDWDEYTTAAAPPTTLQIASARLIVPEGVDVGDVVTFAGTSSTETSGSGALARTVSLSGTSAAETTGSGALAVGRALTGISTTITDGSGALAVEAPSEVLLAGTSTTETTGSGALGRIVAFAGTSPTHTAGSGDLAIQAPDVLLAGTSQTLTDGSGALTRTVTLAGTSATETAGSGDLTTGAAVTLSGTSSTHAAGSGSLAADRPLAGTSATETAGSGDLATLGTVTYAGTSATETSGSGSLTVEAPAEVAFSGTSTTLTVGAGSLAATRSIAGGSSTETAGSGHVAATRPFAGTSATITAGSGELFTPIALTYPFAIFTDTLRLARWDDAEPRPYRWFFTSKRGRWDDADPRPHRWTQTSRPHRWKSSVRPTTHRQAVRPQRYYQTRFVRIEEAGAVPIQVVDMGEFTRGENPEQVLIRWFETRRNGDEEPVGLFGADEEWAATAIIEPPGEAAAIERAATILDPAALEIADPANFPDAEDTVGWIEVKWHRGDLVLVGTYKLQIILEETAETKPLAQRLLLVSQTVWTPTVTDQPATDKALEIAVP